MQSMPDACDDAKMLNGVPGIGLKGARSDAVYMMLVYSRVLDFSAAILSLTVSMWCCTAMYTNLYWASVWTMPERWLRTWKRKRRISLATKKLLIKTKA